MTHATTVAYTPVPTGEKLHASDKLVRAIMGPVGSAKSSTCSMELVLRSMRQAPYHGLRSTRWLAIRNTFNELKTTTLRTLENWLPDEIATVSRSYPPTVNLAFTLPDNTRVESEFLFLALDRPDDVKKLKSLEVTGSWLNEATELQQEILEMALQRSGRFPSMLHGGPSWSGVVLDYNPPPDDHWLYDLFEIEQPQGYQLFRQPPALLRIPHPRYDPTILPASALQERLQGPTPTWETRTTPLAVSSHAGGVGPSGTTLGSMAPGHTTIDPNARTSPYLWVGNPEAENIAHLQGGFDYYLRQVPGKDPSWIDVFVLGQYGASVAGQAVYKSEWSERDHVASAPIAPDKYLPLLLGFDWGLHPAVIFGQLSRTGTLCILDELVPDLATSLEELLDEHLVPLLTEKYRGCKIEGWGDPAGIGRSSLDKRTPFQMVNAIGVSCRPARTNDFLPRRDAVVNFLLRRAGFLLSPTCKLLRKGFARDYHYERYRTTGELRPMPAKNAASHPQDALQYLCLGLRHASMYSNNTVATAGGGGGTSF